MKKYKSIPVIDLFAGPGGLAEGFSSLTHYNKRLFDIRLSIEMDKYAHETLEFRAFYRQFPVNKIPKEYYEVLRCTNLRERKALKEELFYTYPFEAQKAKEEAWCAELGKADNELVDKKIKIALGNEKDWVLIGGPPCQAYSLVGRSRVGGIRNDDHRVHLYKEYLRIIAEHSPAVFVMENVKGLLSARVNGEKVFDWIKDDLNNPAKAFDKRENYSYSIHSLVTDEVKEDSDYLIRCEDYGIPQKRHRVILLGIRNDIRQEPGILKTSEKVTLKDIIGALPRIRSVVNRQYNDTDSGKRYESIPDNYGEWDKHIQKFKQKITSFNGFEGVELNESMFSAELNQGSEFVTASETLELSKEHPLRSWYLDSQLAGVPNHESRSHLLEDLKRYLFASLYSLKYGSFPRMPQYLEYGNDLLPRHRSASSGKFADRFRVQLPDQPATTVTSHISKDGHYFIHYDPSQCRSLTVREAARIQTFPDNYLFWGSRTQQFHQVGNAVPPFLAKQIAEVVHKIIAT